MTRCRQAGRQAWDELCCALAGHRLLLRMMWDEFVFCYLRNYLLRAQWQDYCAFRVIRNE